MVGLLTKQFANMRIDKGNVLVAQGKDLMLFDFNINQEKKYLDRDMVGFWAKAKGLLKPLGLKER